MAICPLSLRLASVYHFTLGMRLAQTWVPIRQSQSSEYVKSLIQDRFAFKTSPRGIRKANLLWQKAT